ncbi:PspC domain-containing protein [Anaeromyxobacter sp. PSR-1]|uniref:PspC domain-containing protein n=1 Tax=unclassified Anaeromyxobacter TaxID=2620896 RepID=UPI0005DFDDFD|nr:PspC domain-containing protein [Anaeromyxobacter sp. PSR-1]GAO03833.1 pspC domain protein [Anaeromyxobacter sp. PSR-1]
MLCPYCRTENAPGATRCAACTSWMVGRPPFREWTRAREGRMIAGVARGLANRFGVPCAAIRLAFLLSVVLGGWGIVVYVALWIAMPEEPLLLPPHAPREDARPAPSGWGA